MNLNLPGATSLTEAQRQERAAQDASDRLAAAHLAARILMLRRHGCTGQGCRKRAHKTDYRLLVDALRAIGAVPDPEAQWALTMGYAGAPRRRREVPG